MNLFLDPNVAYVLLVGGFLLAILALFAPGTGLLELGAFFALFLAGYGILQLSINWWALAILVVGVFPFLLALRRTRGWPYLLVSIVALIAGSVFLFRSETTLSAINPFLAALVSILAAGLMWVIARKGVAAINIRPMQQIDAVVGLVGVARTDIRVEGSVHVGGEEWSCRSREFIPMGSKVRVLSRDGLILDVEPVQSKTV